MQNEFKCEPVTLITPTALMSPVVHGGRAKCLQRLVRLDMPVPLTVALSFDAVHQIAIGEMPDMAAILAPFGDDPLLSVRPSSEDPDWGGPSAILNIGMNDARYAAMCTSIGTSAATALYLKFLRSFAVHVSRLDPEAFDIPANADEKTLAHMLEAYEFETDEPFTQSVEVQPPTQGWGWSCRPWHWAWAR